MPSTSMVVPQETMQSMVDGLLDQDSSSRLANIRKIKHLIIGNRSKKSAFMLLGVVPRLVEVLSEGCVASEELVCEVVITLGSFAHGTADDVCAVVRSRALPVLVRGLLHPSPSVVLCCLRTLRTLYSSGPSPLDSDPIFQDLSISRRLVSLLSDSHSLAQCAATILAKACQSCDHQNLLCAHGIIDPLTNNLLSPVVKLVQSSLLCLSSLVHGNAPAAHLVASASCKGHPFVPTLLRILSGSHSSYTKLLAAKCVVCLHKCGVLDKTSPALTLKVLPALVRLTGDDMEDISTRTDAIATLAYLTESELSLQELTADSDHLISTLVQCLANPPDPDGDLTLDSHLEQFDKLCASVLLLLGSIGSNKEEIRCKVASEREMMRSLAHALGADDGRVKMAATRCLLSLSRSTKLLRTCVFDYDCWKPLLVMLSCEDLQCLQVASAVAANLLLPFSPSRENLVEGGTLTLLSALLEHSDEVIRVNSLWALMGAADGCGQEIKQLLIASLSYEKIVSLLAPSYPFSFLIKAVGLLVNLTQDGSSDWSVVISETRLLSALETLLGMYNGPGGAGGSGGVVEQCLCVLVNLSRCCQKTRQQLVQSEGIVRRVSTILRTSDNVAVLMAAVDFVKNLVVTDREGHVHRQNCLEECGVKFALQKLELEEHKRLRLRVREVMEYFSS